MQHLSKMNFGLKAEYQLVGMSVAEKMRRWVLVWVWFGVLFGVFSFSLGTF